MSALATQDATPYIVKFPLLASVPPTPQSSLTLRNVFDQHYLPILGKRTDSTLRDYKALLNDWERLTDDQSVDVINRRFLMSFQSELAEEEYRKGKNSPLVRRSPATVNKKFRFLKPLVACCFPKDRFNPEGLGIIDYCRFPDRLEEVQRIPKIYSAKQINALMKATLHKSIMWPKYNTALTWQVLIVCGWNFGARTYDLFDLSWKDIDFSYRNGTGAVQFVACKTSKLQRIPMHRLVKAHLRKLRGFQVDTPDVFPQFAATNKKTLYRHWKKLLAHAGIESRRCFEDFRKTCNSTYNDHFDGVGSYVLGHSLSGVNAINYDNPTNRVFQAVQNLPQPKAFKEILKLN